MLRTVFLLQCSAVDLVYHLFDVYVGYAVYCCCFVMFCFSFFSAALCEKRVHYQPMSDVYRVAQKTGFSNLVRYSTYQTVKFFTHSNNQRVCITQHHSASMTV